MHNGYMPWLSLATAAFDISAAIWVLTGPGRRNIVRWTALLLFMLAGYQLAEVWVCANPDHLIRAQLAFCEIVWLPSISVGLLIQYNGGAPRWVRALLGLSFVYCAGMCGWVLTHPDLHHLLHGAGHLPPRRDGLPAGLRRVLRGGHVRHAAGRGRGHEVRGRPHRAHAADLQAGTLGFIVPAFLVQFAWKSLDPSLPSLMCHFALILAIFLVRASWREQRHALRGPEART